MKNLWSGRFKKEMHPVLKCFSYSLVSDSELIFSEICVNEAYAKMLAKVGLVTTSEKKKILKGLKSIANSWKPGDGLKYMWSHEDVHTFIQSELERKIGNAAKKLHTGRSRNDLVVTSTRLYLRDKICLLAETIKRVQRAFLRAANSSEGIIVPGMTHLRKAQPVLLAHHLLAYVEMLEEDKDRLEDSLKRVNVMPLGSAALAGSSLRLDRKFLAKELGFSSISTNSLSAVSDRAFLTEFMSVLSILWMHLSRLSEDFILWNSEMFGFIELDDSLSTGSSLMPQKKNPDVFELIRGRAGVVFGHLQALLTIQKGIPLSYNRDLQEDKPGVFDSIHKTHVALELLNLSISSMSFNKKRIAESLKDDGLFATDILEYMVKKGIAFSEAHELVGSIVRYSVEKKKAISDLSTSEFKKFSKLIDKDIYKIFSPDTSVKGKKTLGSTNPLFVKKEITRWKKILK